MGAKKDKKGRAFICAKYDKYSHLILHFLLVITHFRNVVYSHYFLLFLARCVQSPSNRVLLRWELFMKHDVRFGLVSGLLQAGAVPSPSPSFWKIS